MVPVGCLQSSVCSKIMTELGQNDMDQKQAQVVIISQESFYNTLSNEDKIRAGKGQYNFDHPSKLFFIYFLCFRYILFVCL